MKNLTKIIACMIITLSLGIQYAHAQKIVFYTDRDGNREIYQMDQDGSNPENLSNNDSSDNVPAVSPSGEQIAFVSDRDGNPEIYLMNNDGTNQVKLTSTTENEDHPSWSPDGSKIYYMKDFGTYTQIWVMNSDGTNALQLTSNSSRDERPFLSPDGNKILFMSNRDGHYEVYTMNTDGTNQTRITNSPGHKVFPVWSPDGNKIAYSLNESSGGNFTAEIHVMNADGSGDTTLTNSPGRDENPCWTAGGEQILFQSERDGNFEIYIMNADGSNQQRLSNNASWDGWPTTAMCSGDNLLNYPESAVYDPIQSRYLVSCQGTGAIVEIDAYGNQQYFKTGFGTVIGMTQSNDTLFAVCDNIIRGLKMQNAELVFEHAIPEAIKLNDIAASENGILYVSDVMGDKIYSINVNTNSHLVLADDNLTGPNGLLYEPGDNRLLLVSWTTNSPLQSIDLVTGEVSKIIETGLTNCDGLAKDDEGNYYISEWETGSIHRYDQDFLQNEIIYTRNQGPADIYFNPVKQEISIPLVLGHDLDILPVLPVGMTKKKNDQIIQICPNPFRESFMISIDPSLNDEITIEIVSITGKSVFKKSFRSKQGQIKVNGNNLPKGIYLLNLSVGGKKKPRRFINGKIVKI